MNTIGSYMDACRLTSAAADDATWYSEPEIRLAEELTRRGLKFDQQVRVPRGDTSAVLDFWIEETIAVEVDGKEWHKAEVDEVRDWDMWSEHGIHTMRVRGWKAMRDPEDVVCRIAFRLVELGYQL